MKDWYVNVGFSTATVFDENTAFEFAGKLGGAPVSVERDMAAGSVGIFVTANTIREALEMGADRIRAAADGTIGSLVITRVEAMTDEEFDREAEIPLFPPVVGYAEIARLAGVARQTARDYAKGATFPRAVIETAQGPLYSLAAVESWLENRPNRTERKVLIDA